MGTIKRKKMSLNSRNTLSYRNTNDSFRDMVLTGWNPEFTSDRGPKPARTQRRYDRHSFERDRLANWPMREWTDPEQTCYVGQKPPKFNSMNIGFEKKSTPDGTP